MGTPWAHSRATPTTCEHLYWKLGQIWKWSMALVLCDHRGRDVGLPSKNWIKTTIESVGCSRRKSSDCRQKANEREENDVCDLLHDDWTFACSWSALRTIDQWNLLPRWMFKTLARELVKEKTVIWHERCQAASRQCEATREEYRVWLSSRRKNQTYGSSAVLTWPCSFRLLVVQLSEG